MSGRRVVLSGGGTFGPVMPLLAVVEEVRARKLPWEFIWVGTADGPERSLIERYGIPFVAIPSGKWRRYWDWRNLASPWRTARGFVLSLQFLRRLRPDAVLSVGGYVSVPLAWAARALLIPVVIHEQDVRRGLANQCMTPFATLRTSVWPTGDPMVETIGNLIRPSILKGDARRVRLHWRIVDEIPIVLVIGGGTGAVALNRLVAAARLELHIPCFIFHLTGQGKDVGGAAPRYVPLPFAADELSDLYAAADLVISRAGMGTLSELAALLKPAVVIPIPRSHQEENAAMLERHGAAVILHENNLMPGMLARVINDLFADQMKRMALGQALHELIPNGTTTFVDRLEQIF